MPPRTVWSVGAQVVLLVLLGTALQRLGPVLTLLAVALLLGLAAEPVVRRLQSWGLRRGLGVALIALTLLGITGLLILTLVPLLVEQLQNLVHAAPGFLTELTQRPGCGSWMSTSACCRIRRTRSAWSPVCSRGRSSPCCRPRWS
ncbi:AI-2E family transporter [Corallococcus sp. 4LFB]|uniref:AI-2E family transporter n=1 Tax=Corallococcus sp. 4LFB TaxID=3383249 RepID=UPI0039753B5C